MKTVSIFKVGFFIFLFTVVLSLTGCTENERARSFGGETIVNLPKGQKLVNATWKDMDLWYLTRPMTSTDTAISYTFTESSTYGIYEGTVIFRESK